MIETIAPCSFDLPFRDVILPWTLVACARQHARAFLHIYHATAYFRVAVEDRVLVLAGIRDRLTQLLTDPLVGWWAVALKCRILRRLCSMTKKQYNNGTLPYVR